MTAVNVTASRATPSIGSSVSSAIAAQGRSGRPPVTRFGPAQLCDAPRVGVPRAIRTHRMPSRERAARASRNHFARRVAPRRAASRGARSDHAERRHDWSALRAKKTSEALTHIAPLSGVSPLPGHSPRRGGRGETTGSASGSSARVDTGGTEKGRPCIPVARPLASRARPSERGSRPRAPSLPTLSSR